MTGLGGFLMESYGLVHFLPKGGRPRDVGVSASVQEISKLPDAARDRGLVESLGVSYHAVTGPTCQIA